MFFRNSHPSIKPGQPFNYLGRPMRVTAASRKAVTAHYTDSTGIIRTISIPAFTVETCIIAAATVAARESEEDPSPDEDDDPRFIELN